jgi:hypothetical protein
LVWTKISNYELESESANFVDQGDLFGDGEEEVIVLEQGKSEGHAGHPEDWVR